MAPGTKLWNVYRVAPDRSQIFVGSVEAAVQPEAIFIAFKQLTISSQERRSIVVRSAETDVRLAPIVARAMACDR